ncbi:MAG: DUF4272 domain-containing protein [Myxococcota bacterium]
MTPHEHSPSDLVALLEAHSDAPWAAAWMQALASRGGMPFFPHQETELARCVATGFTPRLRGTSEIAGRAALATHLSAMADRMQAPGEEAGFQRAMQQLLDIGAPGQALEHIELAFLHALQDGDPRGQGAMVSLSWRGHAAAALAWVLGAFPDLEAASAAEMDLVERWWDLSLDTPRPLAAVREALRSTSDELAGLERGTRRHSVLLERKKALRWATEPWWPELALTPWRESDRLNPTTPEEFERNRPESPLRSADDILEMAVTLYVHGSVTADLRRHGLPVLPHADLGTRSGLLPRSREVREFWQRMQAGDRATADELLRMVWLSAAADALFWAAGKLDVLPDGDPPDVSREALAAVLEQGRLRDWIQAGVRRPRAEIEAELSHQLDRVRSHPMGSEPHSFALQRVRALRWVLDYRFADPTVTPWDGTDTPTPFEVAPVPLNPEAQEAGHAALREMLEDAFEPEPTAHGRGSSMAIGLGVVALVLAGLAAVVLLAT